MWNISHNYCQHSGAEDVKKDGITVFVGKKRNKFHSTHPDRLAWSPGRPAAHRGRILSEAGVWVEMFRVKETSPSHIQTWARTLREHKFRGVSTYLETIKQVSDAVGRRVVRQGAKHSAHALARDALQQATCHFQIQKSSRRLKLLLWVMNYWWDLY